MPLRLRWTIAVLTLLVAACAVRSRAAEPRTIGEAQNGKSVPLTVGEFLNVALPANRSTGYGWLIDRVDPHVLAQRGEAQFAPAADSDRQRVGGGGTTTFEFMAKQRGTTEIVLVYRRGADPSSVAPARTFRVTITVK